MSSSFRYIRSRFFMIAVTAVVGLVPVAPIASASVPVSVSIRYDRSAGAFEGRVYDDIARCEKYRTVILKKVVKGPNVTLGRDKTDRSAEWRIDGFRDVSGRFRAKTTKKTFTNRAGETVTCPRHRSVTIRVR